MKDQTKKDQWWLRSSLTRHDLIKVLLSALPVTILRNFKFRLESVIECRMRKVPILFNEIEIWRMPWKKKFGSVSHWHEVVSFNVDTCVHIVSSLLLACSCVREFERSGEESRKRMEVNNSLSFIRTCGCSRLVQKTLFEQIHPSFSFPTLSLSLSFSFFIYPSDSLSFLCLSFLTTVTVYPPRGIYSFFALRIHSSLAPGQTERKRDQHEFYSTLLDLLHSISIVIVKITQKDKKRKKGNNIYLTKGGVSKFVL